MKKRISIILTIFIVFVIYLTPAKLIENLMPPQPNLVVSGFTGSVWSGNIQQITTKNASLSDVDFSLSVMSLLSASPAVMLDILRGDVTGQLLVELTTDPKKSLSLQDVNIGFDASLLENFIPIRGIRLGGKVQAEELSFESTDKQIEQLVGMMHWRNALVNATGLEMALGNFSISAETDEATGTVTAQLLKTENALSLEGKLTLKADGMLEFIGSIATDIDQSLYNTMVLFNDGKPAGGRLPLKFKQKINR